jgi:hypothetical protein
MVVFLLREEHRYTVEDYFQTWGSALAPKVAILPYEKLARHRELPSAVYVFADLERLTPYQQALASQVWEQLAAAGPGFHLLNDPRRSLRRYELLRGLYESGQNCFNVYRATEPLGEARLPAFFRPNKEHTGALTSLLHRPEQVQAALVEVGLLGFDLHELLLVEYVGTADEHGIFRKYSVQRAAEHFLPRHIKFSRNWMNKETDLVEPAYMAEQLHFLQTNPHAEQVRQIFEAAHIEYGRMDYSILGGRLQVWEINTNPQLLRRPDKINQTALPAEERFAEMLGPVFEQLAQRCDGTRRVRIALNLPEAQRLQEQG